MRSNRSGLALASDELCLEVHRKGRLTFAIGSGGIGSSNRPSETE
jgi:hypothetical protein